MYTPEDLVAIQKKTLRTLVSGQIIAAASLASAVTVGAFVVQDILGADTAWSGIASATVTIGTAFMAQLLSLVMTRKGRRIGLQYGYIAAFIGGVIILYGARLADGCTSGHGISGCLQLAVSGWLFFIVMFASGILTAKLLYGRSRQA